jgi:ADP-ribosylglycohydrolase
VRDRVAIASSLGAAKPADAAQLLGSGQEVLAKDTVPFALWAADAHLDSYTDAIWATVEGRGDLDTTCAIVGGIVAVSVGFEGLPTTWLARREPLR